MSFTTNLVQVEESSKNILQPAHETKSITGDGTVSSESVRPDQIEFISIFDYPKSEVRTISDKVIDEIIEIFCVRIKFF